MHSTENNEKVITTKKVSKAERRTKNSKSASALLRFPLYKIDYFFSNLHYYKHQKDDYNIKTIS